MKNNFLIITSIFFSFSMISCKKEGCTDSTASNFDSKAKKDNGSCTYPDTREKYLGNYTVTDSLFMNGSFSNVQTYVLQVTTGNSTDKSVVYLNNLWNGGGSYKAILNGDFFSIPSQQVSGPYYATGSGNFSNSVITYQTSGDIFINKGSGSK